LLDEGISNNLGWRILLIYDRPKNIKNIITKTKKDTSVKLLEILPQDYKDRHMHILAILKKISADSSLLSSEVTILEKAIKIKIDKIRDYIHKNSSSKDKQIFLPQDVNKISIVFSTYVGCKGLSAGYVFVLGLDEGNLPKKNNAPTELEIRKFIVCLTRTIKKCYLISITNFSGQWLKQSIFINWINPQRIDFVNVNKAYFNKRD
jgi:superfamily I DNA/RNA helicase